MSATTESSSSQISPEILKFDDCIDEGGGHQKSSKGLKKPPKNLGLSSTLEQTVLPGRVTQWAKAIISTQINSNHH